VLTVTLQRNLFSRSSRLRTYNLRFWRPTLFLLSYTSMYFAGSVGIEPTTLGLTTHRSTIELQANIWVLFGYRTRFSAFTKQYVTNTTKAPVRTDRLELSTSVWKTVILPLNYTRIFNVPHEGFEPSLIQFLRLQPLPLGYWGKPLNQDFEGEKYSIY
jgi:hypothetical protein